MPTQDLYDILGVARDASPDEIRKAYRRLARKYHPDVNGGDSASTERFKEINGAYEILSDPEKRARYDQFGSVDANGMPGGADFGFGGGFGSFSDIFDMFFGAGTRPGSAERGPEPGANLRYDLELTLEEVLSGVKKTISVTRLEHCSQCHGSGSKAGTQPQTCANCRGAGQVRISRQTAWGIVSQVAECPRCHGAGHIITDPCSHCSGRGLERQTRRIDVDIPPGVEERSRIRLNGQGEAGPNGGPSGDLYVFLHIKPHPKFRRQGRDLGTEIEVSFARAALGGAIQIPTLEGTETLQLPEGTQPGDVFRLRGHGLPELGRPQLRGDLHVVIQVKTPTHLNERQRRALEELAAASGEDLSAVAPPPREKGFFERIRNMFTGQDHDAEN